MKIGTIPIGINLIGSGRRGQGMMDEGELFKEVSYLRWIGEGEAWDVGNEVNEGWGVRFLDLFRFSARFVGLGSVPAF